MAVGVGELMAWLKVDQSLPSHRKTLMGAQLAGMDEHKFLGHLVHFWLWALDHADDNGKLPGLTHDALGQQAGLSRRQATPFIQTLIEAGFLDVVGTCLLIHDWPVYAGKLNERREKEKQRSSNNRATLHQRLTNVPRVLHD